MWRVRLVYHEWLEKILITVSHLLPRSLVSWCVIRVFAEVSTGELASKDAYSITIMEAFEVWDRNEDARVD